MNQFVRLLLILTLCAGTAAPAVAKKTPESEFMFFLVSGKHRKALKAIKQGVDVNVPDRGGVTPLMRYAGRAHAEVLEAMIAAGADIHATDEKGATALHRAAAKNDLVMLNALLRHGVSIDIVDQNQEQS